MSLYRFTAGDRIFIDGEKYTIIDDNYKHPLGLDILALNENDSRHSVAFASNDCGDIKPTKTCYAVLGEKV